jgi:molybdenum cofactor guanylyltransferase
MPLALPRRRTRPPVGCVLAGGEGRRMGGPKAEVELLGVPLVLRALEVLGGAGLRDLAVVAKPDTPLPELPRGVGAWREPEAPRHPVAGLVHALRAAKGRPVVVLACDLPLVPPSLVRLVARSPLDGRRAAHVRGQPLCGRYEPSALRDLMDAPAGARLTDVVAALGPRLVEPLGVDDLLNVNTPEDLLTASALLSRRSRTSSGRAGRSPGR